MDRVECSVRASSNEPGSVSEHGVIRFLVFIEIARERNVSAYSERKGVVSIVFAPKNEPLPVARPPDGNIRLTVAGVIGRQGRSRFRYCAKTSRKYLSVRASFCPPLAHVISKYRYIGFAVAIKIDGRPGRNRRDLKVVCDNREMLVCGVCVAEDPVAVDRDCSNGNYKHGTLRDPCRKKYVLDVILSIRGSASRRNTVREIITAINVSTDINGEIKV